MTTSRRSFVRFGAAAATAAVSGWPLTGISRGNTFEPFQLKHDDGFIRLNSNENAYGPSVNVVEAITSATGSANRYPRMEYGALAERVAHANNVKPEQVVLGCGSTEILRIAAFAFLGKGKQLIQAFPTFEAIERYAHAAGSEIASVRLTPAFAHDLGGMLASAGASTTLVLHLQPQ